MERLTDPLFVLPYDHVLIDEGQDFQDDWIDALESVTHGDFYVFFDRNQLVQQSRMPTWVDRSECRLTLTRNCRNTLQIARISHRAVLGRVTGEDLMPAGPSPVLHACRDDHSMIELAVRRASAWIATSGYAPHEVAVLTMRSTAAKSFLGLSKIGRYPVAEEITPGFVCRNTVRRFKGLEAKAVLLLDADLERFDDPTERNLFYVGCSRANEIEVLFKNVTQHGLSSAIDAMAPGRKIPKTAAGFGRFLNGRWGTEPE